MYEYDVLPLTMTASAASSSAQRPALWTDFTGKERDAETGLDYFRARYYSGAQGRFTTPDPIAFAADRLTDPQRINLYHYARNNPLRFDDPTGKFDRDLHPTITAEALADTGISLSRNAANAIEEATASADNDVFNVHQHFDGMNSAQIAQNFASFVDAPMSIISLDAFGSKIHATEDFYSHSNFVELVLQAHPGLKPEDMPTYQQVMQGDDKALQTQITKNLHSGTFPGSGPNSHSAMNKDNPQTPEGKKPAGSTSTYHTYARRVARKAAAEYIKQHKKEIEAASKCPYGCFNNAQ